MRILLLITGLGMGGAEKVTCDLADELFLRNHEVILVYMTGVPVLTPKNKRVKIIGLGMGSKFDFVRALFRLRNLIAQYRPDVVHSHMIHANILARIVRLLTPICRLISTAHSTNEGGLVRMLAYRVTDRLADISTNVSLEAVRLFEKKKAVKPGRMLAVYNGISTSTFFFKQGARTLIRKQLRIADEMPLILSVGRLHEAKDYPNLLRALAILKAKGRDFVTYIVGIGSAENELRLLTSELSLADRVFFLGARHDVADLMSSADLFVLSSAWEGFGLVVAEAMACERVVVGTDCGGVREIMGDIGFLVPTRNSQALATAIGAALKLPLVKGSEIGKSARDRVEKEFSIEQIIDKWLKIYSGKF